MDGRLLKLPLKRYKCLHCGEWHECTKSHELGWYSERQSLFLDCPEDSYTIRRFNVYFAKGYCNYFVRFECAMERKLLHGKIPIESILESSHEPRVTFVAPFWSKESCDFCKMSQVCNPLYSYDGCTFGFEFSSEDYNKLVKPAQLARKEHELQERENALKGKEQSLQECESALSTRELKQQQRQEEKSTQLEIEEDATMANNIFNMNMEFGPNKDKNIASTLMGVAVKNGGSWRIYDKKKKELTDVGDMQLGNLPIFILPTTELNEGDLIKDAGEYYFVMKVAKGSTQTLCAKTGEMKTVIPIKNVLGFSCYSKIIALSDSINMGDDFDVEKLAIMSAMCGQTGEDGGQMNQLLPLMLFKDKLGGDEDRMKMMLMSSMMGGNMAGKNNPVMSYLMLDMLMGTKKRTNSLLSGSASNKS